MALTTSSDARAFVDYRTISDLALRDSTSAVMTTAEVDADANWLAALSTANGRLLAAVTMGDRYTSTEIAALTSEAKSLRDKLVAMLALQVMVEGRPDLDKAHPQPAAHAQAEQDLFWLRNGEELFG